MNSKGKIALIYTVVAVLCAGIIGAGMFLRRKLPQPELPPLVDTGKQTPDQWFQISRDLEGTNQDGQKVKLSDLKGKVFLIAEFFAVCPHCAERNGVELRALYETFRSNPDFQIVCVSVDPNADNVERLKDYATAMGAETKNWWFLNAGDEKATHEYFEKELKFLRINERTVPADIAQNGRFSHDLSFMLVGRDWQVLGKWPLAESRSEEAKQRDPGMYERLKTDLYARTRKALEKTPETATP